MASASPAVSIHRTLSPPSPLQPGWRGPVPLRCTHSERGVSFDPGSAFYRSDSALGRDLAVLAATLHRQRRPDPSSPFLCLDAMCGSGVRALRYLAQAGADFVWANDASDALRPVVVANLSRFQLSHGDGQRRWVVSHLDATRLLAERYLRREYFDVIDVDSFGSEAEYIRAAFLSLKIGGLAYLTSTDWRSARGYGGKCSLSSYGAYIRPVPYPNEIGLRMLIGGAARESAMLGFHIKPVFSYYASHGPIYRAMVQLCHGKEDDISNYGFICHCKSCGQTQTFGFDELGQISCGCADRADATSITVVGPLWTGSLHDSSSITEMLNLAVEWGWAYTSENGTTLQKLLDTMIEESDPRLPPGYTRLDEIASRAKVNSPPLGTLINSLRKFKNIYRAMVQLCHGKEDDISNYGFICHCKSCGQTQTFGFDELGQISCGCADRAVASRAKVNSPPLGTLINSLRKEGYAACRSHIGANAIKTNCPINSCIAIAREIRNLR